MLEKAFQGLFATDEDRDIAIDWHIANDGRRPVVLVGAGFSRNAKRRDGGGAATSLPDWNGVLDRLRADLPTDCKENDPLTLPELYAAHMEEGPLHQALLDLVPDNDVVPDRAHDALLAYDAEAIVTTNLLDTLLERAAACRQSAKWHRVVYDHDVAIYEPDKPTRQIIYLHGHRGDYESWVLRRSQYEEIASSKPVIVARVRQLFAQHQLLAVGYSMTDPDFHLFYRRINRDMKGRQPRGLSLVLAAPDRATRAYWRKLNISIATLQKQADYNDIFSRFFGSGEPRVTRVQFSEVLAGKALAECVAIWAEYLNDPARERFIAPSSEYTDFDLAWDILVRFIPEERKTRIDSDRKRVFQERRPRRRPSEGSAPESRSDQSAPVVLRFFPALNAFGRGLLELDAIVESQGWEPVAKWVTLIFCNDALRRHAEEQIGNLASVVSTCVRKAAVEGKFAEEEARAVIKKCLEFDRRYELGDEASIAGDLVALGEVAPEKSAKSAAPFSSLTMEALDGKWSEAFSHYDELFRSLATGDAISLWLAAQGRAAAFDKMMGRPWSQTLSPEVQQRSDDYRNQARQLARHADVERWKKLAKESVDRKWINEFVMSPLPTSFEAAVGASRGAVETPSGRHFILRDHSVAAISFANIVSGAQIGEFLGGFLVAVDRGTRLETISNLDGVRWYSRILKDEVSVEHALSICIGALDGMPAGRHEAGCVNAVANIMRAATELRVVLPVAKQSDLLAWTAIRLESKAGLNAEVLHGAAEVVSNVVAMRSTASEVSPLARRIYEIALVVNDELNADVPSLNQVQRLEARCRVLSTFLEQPDLRSLFAADVQACLEDVRRTWPGLTNFIKNNPRYAYAFVRFLLLATGRVGGPKRAPHSLVVWASQAVFHLASTEPSVIPMLSPLFLTKLTSQEKVAFEGLLSAGGWREARADWQIGVADLVREIASEEAIKRMPLVCASVLPLLILATGDREVAVANHAAYALVSSMERFGASSEGVVALERLSDDSRVTVRHAAAYGAARLQLTLANRKFRERMVALDQKIASDRTIVIERQRALGRAEGERVLKARKRVIV